MKITRSRDMASRLIVSLANHCRPLQVLEASQLPHGGETMKTKYVVFSYAAHGTECFIDFVMASSLEEAKQEVAQVRQYAVPVFETDLRGLYQLAYDLVEMSPQEVEASWRAVKTALAGRERKTSKFLGN